MTRPRTVPGATRRINVDVSDRFWKRMEQSGMSQGAYLEALLSGIDSTTQTRREAKEAEIRRFEVDVQVKRAALEAELGVLKRVELEEAKAKDNWATKPLEA